MNDPFNAKDGIFAKNIRSIIDPDDTELRQSLALYGWHPEIPGIRDEHGVLLVGHRRLKICEDLKIQPVIKTIKFGSGKEADAERLKIALITNIGAAPMSKADRQRIAEYLYGKRKWTMVRIGEALGLSHQTISRYLENLSIMDKIEKPGRGRPRKDYRKEPPPPKHPKAPAIIAGFEAGKPAAAIAKEVGVNYRTAGVVIVREKIERQVKEEAGREFLSKTAQGKFDAAIRKEKQRLAQEFEARVQTEIETRMAFILPEWRKRLDQADKVIKARRGIMLRVMFNKIKHCLHPDSRNSISDKRLNAAFDDFSGFEKLMVAEPEYPTPALDIPSSYAELMKRKEAVKAARQNKRALRP